ncbi:unnamed protein product [Sphenostylis stenocarpa]|uniref:Uncharacterized protein n=1 Tax=Sphenostylis stenocarpa TaxID=92480 RepID=A0AA86RTZ5_9FABA|nr:unnamed protein product [Sphenostylis stenocarpa]
MEYAHPLFKMQNRGLFMLSNEVLEPERKEKEKEEPQAHIFLRRGFWRIADRKMR